MRARLSPLTKDPSSTEYRLNRRVSVAEPADLQATFKEESARLIRQIKEQLSTLQGNDSVVSIAKSISEEDKKFFIMLYKNTFPGADDYDFAELLLSSDVATFKNTLEKIEEKSYHPETFYTLKTNFSDLTSSKESNFKPVPRFSLEKNKSQVHQGIQERSLYLIKEALPHKQIKSLIEYGNTKFFLNENNDSTRESKILKKIIKKYFPKYSINDLSKFLDDVFETESLKNKLFQVIDKECKIEAIEKLRNYYLTQFYVAQDKDKFENIPQALIQRDFTNIQYKANQEFLSLVNNFYNSGEFTRFENRVLNTYIQHSDITVSIDSKPHKAFQITIPGNLDEFQKGDSSSLINKSPFYIFKDDSNELKVYSEYSQSILNNEDAEALIDETKQVIFLRELQAAKHFQDDYEKNDKKFNFKLNDSSLSSYSKYVIENNLQEKNQAFLAFAYNNRKTLETLWGLAYNKVFNRGTWERFLINQAFKEIPKGEGGSVRSITTKSIRAFQDKAKQLFSSLDKEIKEHPYYNYRKDKTDFSDFSIVGAASGKGMQTLISDNNYIYPEIPFLKDLRKHKASDRDTPAGLNLITTNVLNQLIKSNDGFINSKLISDSLEGEFAKAEIEFRDKVLNIISDSGKVKKTDSSHIGLNSIKGDAWEQLAISFLNLKYPDSEIVPQLCTYVDHETGIYTHRVDAAVKNSEGKWDLFEVKWGGDNGNADFAINESILKQRKSAKLTGQDKYFGDYTVFTLTDGYTLRQDFKDQGIKVEDSYSFLDSLGKTSLQDAPLEILDKLENAAKAGKKDYLAFVTDLLLNINIQAQKRDFTAEERQSFIIKGIGEVLGFDDDKSQDELRKDFFSSKYFSEIYNANEFYGNSDARNRASALMVNDKGELELKRNLKHLVGMNATLEASLNKKIDEYNPEENADETKIDIKELEKKVKNLTYKEFQDLVDSKITNLKEQQSSSSKEQVEELLSIKAKNMLDRLMMKDFKNLVLSEFGEGLDRIQFINKVLQPNESEKAIKQDSMYSSEDKIFYLMIELLKDDDLKDQLFKPQSQLDFLDDFSSSSSKVYYSWLTLANTRNKALSEEKKDDLLNFVKLLMEKEVEGVSFDEYYFYFDDPHKYIETINATAFENPNVKDSKLIRDIYLISMSVLHSDSRNGPDQIDFYSSRDYKKLIRKFRQELGGSFIDSLDSAIEKDKNNLEPKKLSLLHVNQNLVLDAMNDYSELSYRQARQHLAIINSLLKGEPEKVLNTIRAISQNKEKGALILDNPNLKINKLLQKLLRITVGALYENSSLRRKIKKDIPLLKDIIHFNEKFIDLNQVYENQDLINLMEKVIGFKTNFFNDESLRDLLDKYVLRSLNSMEQSQDANDIKAGLSLFQDYITNQSSYDIPSRVNTLSRMFDLFNKNFDEIFKGEEEVDEELVKYLYISLIGLQEKELEPHVQSKVAETSISLLSKLTSYLEDKSIRFEHLPILTIFQSSENGFAIRDRNLIDSSKFFLEKYGLNAAANEDYQKFVAEEAYRIFTSFDGGLDPRLQVSNDDIGVSNILKFCNAIINHDLELIKILEKNIDTFDVLDSKKEYRLEKLLEGIIDRTEAYTKMLVDIALEIPSEAEARILGMHGSSMLQATLAESFTFMERLANSSSYKHNEKIYKLFNSLKDAYVDEGLKNRISNKFEDQKNIAESKKPTEPAKKKRKKKKGFGDL
ncbi:MAG: hypothetical protein HRT47_03115 [Candidatus Caenarcaniphilales bacterium]|nr:hypothetical protein [Candidatus Caenarcaniphilales bacterium]